MLAGNPHADTTSHAQPRRKGLLAALGFQQRRVRSSIREHQAVNAELTVIGHVTEVAAVGPYHATIAEGFV